MFRARPPAPTVIPARRAIASRPTNVSRQPRGAAVAVRAVRLDGHVPELAAVAVGAAEELAVDEDAAADADLAEDADEVVEAARGALPVLGERGEVGLVVGAHGEPGSRAAISSATAISDQARFGAPQERAGLLLDDARERDRDADRDEVVGRRRRRAPALPSARAGSARAPAASGGCPCGRGARGGSCRSDPRHRLRGSRR